MASTLNGPTPIRATTRALAAMQTAVNAFGLKLFDGDLDRFALFALVIAQTHPDVPGSRPIAVNSLAMSVARPFETVRRHINALIAKGLCARVDGGVAIVPATLDHPDIAAGCDLAHDAFVSFVIDFATLGLLPPAPPAVRPYRMMVGVDAAVQTMFAAAESNRLIHQDWLSLSIFSAVLLANARRYEAFAPLGGVPIGAAHVVRASVIARVLNLPETTVRRRLATLTAPGGPLLRSPRGVLVSTDWLDAPDAADVSANTYAALRRILVRAGSGGFPFDDPASVYRVGPPPMPFD